MMHMCPAGYFGSPLSTSVASYAESVAFRGAFFIDDPEGQRWELGLELLGQGKLIVLRDIGLRLEGESTLAVVIPSSWLPQNVTDATAREDLQRGRRVVEELICANPEFASLVAEREISYELVDDYDTGYVLLGTPSSSGEVRWAVNISQYGS